MKLFLLQLFLGYSVLISLFTPSPAPAAVGAKAYFYAQHLSSFKNLVPPVKSISDKV